MIFLKPMSSTRPIYVPLSAVAAAFPIPTPSSGLPLLSGLCFDGRLLEPTFSKQDFFIPSLRENIPSLHENIPSFGENIPSFGENIPSLRENIPSFNEGSPFSRKHPLIWTICRVCSAKNLGEGVEWRRRRFFAAFILRLLMAAKTERQRPTEHPDPFKQPFLPWLLKGGAPKRIIVGNKNSPCCIWEMDFIARKVCDY